MTMVDSSAVFDLLFEEDDDDSLLQVFMHSVCQLLVTPEERNASHLDQRLAWNEFANAHAQRGTFDIRMRMSKASFDKLLAMIQESLMVNETKASIRGGTILPELCLYCTLRWLAGGSYLDITDISGISKSSFYRVVWKTITAIVQCKELLPKFPKTNASLGEVITGFTSLSTLGTINNCAGAVDGYLCRIKVPSKTEVKNVK
jgi:hypothetical protein